MGDVVIIGAGVTGIQAALDLANHGIRVHLVEREPSIGGHMAQLDKTFPTNDCSMCILSPKMAEVAIHPFVTIHTCTEVDRVEGEAGHFTVSCRKHPRFIDESLCTGCGDCIEICPVEVYNRFDAGVGVRKAIYKPHQQAIPDIVLKDNVHCIECGLCYDACGPGAIRKEDEEVLFDIPAAAIIIASGYTVFDPSGKPQFRHLDLPDVITSLEFERMMNASGPTGGKVKRLSDGKIPGHVVFIQCVGSRDVRLGCTSCGAVCCMAALKNAMLIREKYPETEVTILYMDIRAYGKGYEEYYERAQKMGIRFIRGIPGTILGNDTTMEIRVENTEKSEMVTLRPDLVILSVGLRPDTDTARIAETIGLPLEKSGFLKSENDAVRIVETEKPGVYIAGAAVSPKDIPDCVALAGAAAMKAFIDATRE
jgi:heterodisulfide reductase subunit A